MQEQDAPDSVRVVKVDTSVYGLTAVLKSGYQFTGRAYLHIQRTGEGELEIRLRPKQAGINPDDLAGEFLNDLIDQRLREIVAKETQAARDLILAHALSKTSLLHLELETTNPFPDHETGNQSRKG
jgi:His-Xaa-Ser system protein HxsD